MIETVKRHAFLVGLVAGVVLVSLAVAIAAYVGYTRPAGVIRAELKTARTRVADLGKGPVYTPELVDELADPRKGEVAKRKAQYEGLLDYIRKLGHDRQLLVPGLFPQSTDPGPRLSFKVEYDAALKRFVEDLDGIAPPPPPGKGVEAERDARSEEKPKGLMYVHPKISFVRPAWVDKIEAPSLEECRDGQENIWLMEDVVGLIKAMESDLMKDVKDRTIENSPIKELVEIRIGMESGTLGGVRTLSSSGRYMPPSAAAKPKAGEKVETPRAPTLTGRWSMPDEKDSSGKFVKPGFYKVLPFRLVVVVESRYASELLRRMKGTESFITVNGFAVQPVTEATFEGTRLGLTALSRKVYGPRGVVRLEVVAESLIFQLEGGRLTTPPAVEVKAAAKTPKG
jgi:hypothetical protein